MIYKNYKTYRIYIFSFLFLSISACERNLDFKYHDIEPLTVIEGELTDAGAKVGITLTTPMDESMDHTRLTDASVSITDLTDDSTYSLTPDTDGYYTDPKPGIPGHRYRLTVARDGNTHSMETIMYAPTEIVDAQFNWIRMPYDMVAVFQARYLDNPDDNGECYWVKLYRNGEIYRWQEQDDRTATAGVNTYFTMTSRKDTDEEDDDDVLYDGDVMTVMVTPITREMHDYLEALQNDSNGPFLFSGTRVLGYFLASTPTYRSVTFHPDRIPEYK